MSLPHYPAHESCGGPVVPKEALGAFLSRYIGPGRFVCVECFGAVRLSEEQAARSDEAFRQEQACNRSWRFANGCKLL